MRPPHVDAPLVVSTDGTAGPYVTVTTDQLGPVAQALRVQGIPIEVDDDAVILDGRPALSVIDLGHDADIEKVQRILDALVAAWRGERGETKSAPTARKELIVRFPAAESDKLVNRLKAAPPFGWSRRPEIEDRMRKLRALKADAYCFSKNIEPSLGEVAVWLEARGARELYVSTIIPLQTRKPLGVEQYNHILEDFEKTFIEPLMSDLKGHVFNYQAPTEPTLEEVLSADSMRRLKAFSATANKGMPHPLDMQRWHAFIARTHLEDAVVEPSLLSDWLQGDGWPEDQRARLIHDYERGRSLLSIYDEERVDR